MKIDQHPASNEISYILDRKAKGEDKAPLEINFSAIIVINEAEPYSWTINLQNIKSGIADPLSPAYFIYTIYWGPKDKPTYIKSYYLTNIDQCKMQINEKVPFEDGDPTVELIQYF